MADYHAILKRAISALPSPTGEARRAVYEKARTALVNQLKSFDPPLSASDITQQRLQLEDAIRKVESEAAKGLLRQPQTPPPAPVAPPPPPTEDPASAATAPAPSVPVAAPAPSVPPPAPAPAAAPPPEKPVQPPVAPPPGSPVETAKPGAVVLPPKVETPPAPAPEPAAAPTAPLKRAVDEAGALGGATAELGRQARDALAEAASEPPAPAFGREGAEKVQRSAEKKERRRRRREVVAGETAASRLSLLVGVGVAILVVGIGVVALWSQREAISAFFGGARAPVVDMAQRQSGEKLAPKSSDRLTSDESAGRVTNPVKPVATQTITPGPAQPQLQSSMAGNGTGEAAKPPVPAQQAVPLVAQKAILYEEGKVGGGQAQISPGKVVWAVVPDPTDPRPGAMKLEAKVEIPDRNFALTLQMRPNSDNSFPASHLIELKFALPPDFDGKSVGNVPGLIMKATEQARGDPLSGAAAKVADNYFWIALGASEQDRTRNFRMIRERGWIDVPILYETTRRAILTLEKAGAGDQAVTEALAAWGQGN